MLPEVENPIPETIGLDTLSRRGVAAGFALASAFYLLSLAVQAIM